MQVWGDFFLCQLKEMLSALCAERRVADCEFFLNKRDYPHLKVTVEADGRFRAGCVWFGVLCWLVGMMLRPPTCKVKKGCVVCGFD
jgi:hypothetical protein